MKNIIETKDMDGKIYIYTPFELKDTLRSAFKRAKWCAKNKAWYVSASSKARVESFVEEVKASGIIEEIEKREVTALEAKEIESLQCQLGDIKSRISSNERKLRENIERSERADVIIKHIDLSKAKLDKIKLEVAEAQSVADAKEKELEEKLQGVVSFDEIRRLLFELSKVAGVPKAYANDKRKKIEGELFESYRKAKSAGVILSGLLENLLEKSFNRISRSDVSDAEAELMRMDPVNEDSEVEES